MWAYSIHFFEKNDNIKFLQTPPDYKTSSQITMDYFNMARQAVSPSLTLAGTLFSLSLCNVFGNNMIQSR